MEVKPKFPTTQWTGTGDDRQSINDDRNSTRDIDRLIAEVVAIEKWLLNGGGTGNTGPAGGDLDGTYPNPTVATIGSIAASAVAAHVLVTNGNPHGITPAMISAVALTALGAPLGVATLDMASKVIQNPAQATVVPGAFKIPIADSFGTLDSWITPNSNGTQFEAPAESSIQPIPGEGKAVFWFDTSTNKQYLVRTRSGIARSVEMTP